MNELLRRVVLVVCIGLSVGVLRYADLGDYIVAYKVTISYLRTPGWGMWSLSDEQKERLSTLPVRELIRERENASLVIAQDGRSLALFEDLKRAFELGQLPGMRIRVIPLRMYPGA